MTKLIALTITLIIGATNTLNPATHTQPTLATTRPTPVVVDPPAPAPTQPTPVVVDTPTPAPPTQPGTITAHNADPDQQATLDEALTRFAANDLHLPDLDIYFANNSDDRADCNGAYGVFLPDFEPKQIIICSDFDFVLTHELGHAWINAHIDHDGRATYTQHRNLKAWTGADIEWQDRATEDAATTIQQNLMAPNPPAGSTKRQQRISAYELLTGNTSPLTQQT